MASRFLLSRDKFLTFTDPYSFIHGDGSNTRRYIYATDVADAIDTILHRGSIGSFLNLAPPRLQFLTPSTTYHIR